MAGYGNPPAAAHDDSASSYNSGNECERAALEWTEALTLIHPDHVADAVWEAVQPHFSAEEITNLTLLIVAINGRNRCSIAFRKAPE